MKYGLKKLVGIDNNFIFDFIIGIVIAIAFFILGNIFGIVGVIGVPSFPQSIVSDIGAFLIIVIGASVFESVLFFDIILDFFNSKLKWSFIIASFIASLSFSLFHVYVYGQALQSSGGSLVSAFVVGMGWCMLRYYTDSLMAVISSHGTLNFVIEFIMNRGWIKF